MSNITYVFVEKKEKYYVNTSYQEQGINVLIHITIQQC